MIKNYIKRLGRPREWERWTNEKMSQFLGSWKRLKRVKACAVWSLTLPHTFATTFCEGLASKSHHIFQKYASPFCSLRVRKVVYYKAAVCLSRFKCFFFLYKKKKKKLFSFGAFIYINATLTGLHPCKTDTCIKIKRKIK